jgi:hypothetical protein
MSIETTTDFSSVDSSKDPQFFLRFLDAANKNPSVVASKPIILDGLRLRAGARVLVRGGRISVFDMDWETQVCDSPYKETTRTIALTFCDGMKNGWIGRRMPRLFKSHGIVDVAVETKTVFVTYEFLKLLLGGHVARLHDTGVISREEANQWWTSLAAADRDGTFLYGFTAFMVSGTKA